MKNQVMMRSTSRSQLRKGDRPWEGRLGDSHEPMNKNLIRGRQREVSWHNTAKPFDSSLEVNEAVVWRRTMFLPGEISIARGRESDSAGRSNALGDDREVSRGHSSWDKTSRGAEKCSKKQRDPWNHNPMKDRTENGEPTWPPIQDNEADWWSRYGYGSRAEKESSCEFPVMGNQSSLSE